MPSFPISNSHNVASSCGSDNDLELGYVNPSGEQSELVGSVERCERGRRGALPGLPGGRALGELEPEISDEVLDALLAGASTAQEIAGPDGVLAHLTRRLLNRALEVELTAHLGYAAGQAPRREGRGRSADRW